MANGGSFGEATRANADRWAQLASGSRNKNTLSLAQSLLGVSSVPAGGGKVTANVNDANNSESLFGRLIDLLTTPLSGVAGFVGGFGEISRANESGAQADWSAPLKGAAEGVGGNLYSVATGDPNIEGKRSFTQVLRDAQDANKAKQVGLKPNQLDELRKNYDIPDDMQPFYRGLNFGLDVFADPLTYAGGIGLASKGKLLAKYGSEADKLAEEARLARGVEYGNTADPSAPLGTAANPRPQGGSNKLAITSTPEGMGDNGQLLLPGTRVPKVEPGPQRAFTGEEIPAGDYQLPGQLHFPGTTGRQTRPKASQQQGTLFNSEPFRVENPVKPAERGYEATGELPANVQGDRNSLGLLFTKGGEPYKAWVAPKASEVVKDIPAPKNPKVLAADLNEALAPVVAKAGVSPEAVAKVTQVFDEAKVAELKNTPIFEQAAAPVAKAVKPIDKKQATNAAVGTVLKDVLGAKIGVSANDLNRTIPVEFGTGLNPVVKQFKVGTLGAALFSGNPGKYFEGAKFMTPEGKYISFEDLVSKVQGHVNAALVAPTQAVAPASTVQTVSKAWSEAAKAAGFTDSQIKKILKSKDAQKRIDEIVASSKAVKEAEAAAPKAVESGVAPAAPVVDSAAPIPQQLSEAAVIADKQVADGQAAITEVVGAHPDTAPVFVKTLKERAEAISADKRARPAPEIAAAQREKYGVTHSVPNPQGVARNNPHHQRLTLSKIGEIVHNSKAYKATLKKGQKVTPEQLSLRANMMMQFLRASEEALKGLGHPPMVFWGSNSAFRLSEFLTAVGNDLKVSPEELLINLGWLGPYSPGPLNATYKELAKVLDASLTKGFNEGLTTLATQMPSVKAYLETGKVVQAALDTKAVTETIPEIGQLFSLGEAAKGVNLASDAENLKLATHDVPVAARELVAEKGGSDAAVAEVVDAVAPRILGVADNAMPGIVDKTATTATKKAEIGDATVDHIKPALEAADEMNGASTLVEKIAGTENRWANLFLAWHGYKDLYHLQAQKVQGALSIANLYMHVYANTIKELALTPEDMVGAWKAVRGELTAVPANVEKAVEFVNVRMANAVEAIDTASAYKIGTSVVNRSGLTMEELNAQLKITGLDFQFHIPKVAKGEKPVSWKESWKLYGGDVDPMTFAAKVETAITRAAARKAFFADMHYIFHNPKGVLVDAKKYPELAGTKIDPVLVPQLDKAVGQLDHIMSPSGEFGKAIDSFLSSWKTIVTIPLPSHHIRNLIGDLFFAYLAGVPIGNPVLIRKMQKVMAAQRHFYKDIADNPETANTTQYLLDMLQGNAAERNILTSKPGDIVSRITVGKRTIQINARDMWGAAFERGVLKHSALIEDIPSASISEQILNKTQNPLVHAVISPTGGKFMKGARKVSETREHGVRMLHFIDAAEKAVKRNLARGMNERRALQLGFDEAAARVTKWHPDGTGLTDVERKVMRRTFPFYSWTRKAIPLLAESMLTNPAKLTLYPKFMHDVVGAENQQDLANPWPVDQVFPRWLREMPIGPVGNVEDGYTVVNPSNPFTDLGNQFLNDPRGAVTGMLNPLARVPMEVMTGTDSQTGAPIKDWSIYADKQIPQLALANRAFNTDLGFGSLESALNGDGLAPPNKTGKATGNSVNTYNLINMLTAAGLIDASQSNYVTQGQFEIKDKKAAESRKRREEALKNQAQGG